MEIKLLRLKFNKIATPNFIGFMKNCKLKDNSMNQIELREVYDFPICSTDSIKTTNKGFLHINNGQEDGTHWV